MDINVFAKYYEILSLPFKPKHRGRTDGQCENSIPPCVCGGYNKIDTDKKCLLGSDNLGFILYNTCHVFYLNLLQHFWLIYVS